MTTRRTRWLMCFLLCFSARLHGSMTLFVEEPYGPFGAMSPTGHAAIYLTNVCAETPILLRHCKPGESGVVISRYSHIHGYDWIAIPLIPYLYAVDQPDKILEWSNPKAVSYLRQSYRNQYLRELVPEDDSSGAWTQLVGVAYNRRIYGLEIETTEEQDNRLIQELNSKPNRSHFNFFFHNCADFARKIIDLNHPKSVRRSFSADLGFTTPKQLAKCLVNYGKLHPDLRLSVFVIPQIPGELARSHKVRGVCEALCGPRSMWYHWRSSIRGLLRAFSPDTSQEDDSTLHAVLLPLRLCLKSRGSWSHGWTRVNPEDRIT